MKHSRVFVVVAFACALLLVWRDEGITTREGGNEAVGGRSVPLPNSGPSGAHPFSAQLGTGGAVTAFSSLELVQRVVSFEGGSTVTTKTFERETASASSPTYESTIRYSTAYAIDMVKPRWAYEFYVLGLDALQTEVIERWTIEPEVGAWDVDRPTYNTPIGVSIPSHETPTLTLVGGSFIPPAERAHAPRLKRRMVYRSQELGQIRNFTVDANGRFLLALAEDGSLYRIELPPSEDLLTPVPGQPPIQPAPAEPELLYSSDDVPHLVYADMFYRGQHAQLGRMYAVTAHSGTETQGANEVTVWFDYDNDGVLDSNDTYVGLRDWLLQREADPDWVEGFFIRP